MECLHKCQRCTLTLGIGQKTECRYYSRDIVPLSQAYSELFTDLFYKNICTRLVLRISSSMQVISMFPKHINGLAHKKIIAQTVVHQDSHLSTHSYSTFNTFIHAYSTVLYSHLSTYSYSTFNTFIHAYSTVQPLVQTFIQYSQHIHTCIPYSTATCSHIHTVHSTHS